jgi:hypothetical protein
MGFLSRIKSWLGEDASWTPLGEGGARGGGYGFNVHKASQKSLSPRECYELSIAVNAAVNAICRNGSRATPRAIDSKSGEEIIEGDLIDRMREPVKGMPFRKWLWEILAWYNIDGEFAVWATGDGMPESLPILAPCMLRVETPVKPPNSLNDVARWEYRWTDGARSLIRGDRLAFDRLFNPDPTSIRGLSPLLTGTVTVTAQHRADLYNKTFFENNAVPSHILKLPDGVPEATRKDIERRWMSEHGVYSNNAHKIAVISGTDAEFIPIEQPFQEGAFVELQKRADYKVGQLYRVPAIELGIYDKTRFDTANEERKLFAESTLLPQLDAIGDCIQFQIVARHYSLSRVHRRRPRKPAGKHARERFETAMDERKATGVPIVFWLDPDSMPVMNDVALSKMEHAEKLRTALDFSAQEAIDYIGIDAEEREERKAIWVKNDRVNITDPEFNKKIIPGLVPKPAGEGGPPKGKKSAEGGEGITVPQGALAGDTPAPPLSPDSRKRLRTAEKFLRQLRIDTLKGLAKGDELWGLSDMDGRADEAGIKPEMWTLIRRARHAARTAVKNHPNDTDAACNETREAFKRLFADAEIRKAMGL